MRSETQIFDDLNPMRCMELESRGRIVSSLRSDPLRGGPSPRRPGVSRRSCLPGRSRHRPVTALADWITVRGVEPGPLFTSVRRGTGGAPISGNAVARSPTRPGSGPGRPPHHGALAACRACDHSGSSRRQPGPDRRTDPASPAEDPRRALHPTRAGIADNLGP